MDDKRQNYLIFLVQLSVSLFVYCFCILIIPAREVNQDGKVKINSVTAPMVYDQDNAKEGQEKENTVENDETVILENRIYSVAVSENNYLGEADAVKTIRAYRLLRGRSFYVTNTMLFIFDAADGFDGFFDAENISVSGYCYEITVLYDRYYLNIYDPEHTVVVSYQLLIDDTDSLCLFYPTDNLLMELKKIRG